MLNAPEIIVIGVVIFIFVGAKRMPELAKSLGQGIREFRKAAGEATDEAVKAMTESAPSPSEKVASPPEISREQTTRQNTESPTHPAGQLEDKKIEESHL